MMRVSILHPLSSLTSSLRPSAFRLSRGFTLVEMLAVLAIISVLMGLTVGAVFLAQRHARRKNTEIEINNLKMSLSQYNTDYRDYPDGDGRLDGPNIFASSEALYEALTTSKGKYGPYITDTSALRPTDQNNNGKPEITDYFGTPIRYTHSRYYTANVDGPEGEYLIESAGPDREFGTEDDIKSWKKVGK
jgi:prepilin-type N-terminal cleavage/methylation domain-containing protein